MIISGKEVAEAMIEGVVDNDTQIQANGYDMTVKQVNAFVMDSRGCIDFDNSKREKPDVKIVPFNYREFVILRRGCYLLDINPKMKVPMDCIGRLRPRSSIIRMGCNIVSGVWDAGYVGTSQVLLVVHNFYGIKLYKNARIGQMVMEKMDGGCVEKGYDGVYNESE